MLLGSCFQMYNSRMLTLNSQDQAEDKPVREKESLIGQLARLEAQLPTDQEEEAVWVKNFGLEVHQRLVT
jgi:hypothetical protein